MKIFRSLAEVPADFGPSVATVGNFDGVHCGHKTVLGEVLASARKRNAKAVAVTFTPHPTQVVRPESAPLLVTPDAVKLELLAQVGLDAVLMLDFTPQLRTTSAQEFADRVLCKALHAVEVHEGDNFQFGYHGEGSVSGLQQLGKDLGFSTVVSPPLLFAGKPVSSSRVRKCIAAGKLAEARHLLGRDFSVRSSPASGRGYGSRYTVPTINLASYAGLLPAHGVYVTDLTVHGETFQSVTNVGNRPTFGGESFAVESYILNFHPIALDESTRLDLTFHFRLRSEEKFETHEALKELIFRDVQRAKRWFALRSALHTSATG
jgi:riboflavin kinase/FMN adenylyltransferase